MFIKLLYWYSFLTTFFISEVHSKTPQDIDRLCNQTLFEQSVVEKNEYVNLAELNGTCSAHVKSDCNVYQVQYTTVEVDTSNLTRADEYKEEYAFYVCAVNYTQHSDCWGLVLEYKDGHPKPKTLYDKYFEPTNTSTVCWSFPYALNTFYQFKTALLPIGKNVEFNWTSPGFCEIDTMKELRNGLKKMSKKMSKEMDDCIELNQRLAFANKICSQFIDDNQRREFLQARLEFKNCEIHIRNGTKTPADNKTIIVAISVVSVVVTLMVFALVLRWCLRERRNVIHKVILQNDEIYHEQADFKNHRPSVLILNRPGCELLEVFLRDFAFILKSYQVDVKLALLEQNEIDSQGGISSYMQKNINTCDYILIFISNELNEKQESQFILKHKPYEFALKVLGGLAYHQNDASRYIPVYLSSYRDIVQSLPSFLNATATFGYQIPKDLEQLIKRIYKKDVADVLASSKERHLKDKFFISKMKEQAKKILEKRHPHCLTDNCLKEKVTSQDVGVKNQGESYSSTQNLSSIWPSTVHSKWRSISSLDDHQNDKNADQKEHLDDILQYKLQTLLHDQERSVVVQDELANEIDLLLRQQSNTSSDGIICENYHDFNDDMI